MEDPKGVEKEESHTKQKKARRGPSTSLAFRVLFISFIFIILPLLIYTFLTYSREYHRKLNSVFKEMKLFQEDQITMVRDIENDADNFLITFVSILTAMQHEGQALSDFELEPILLKYAERGDLTAVFLLEEGRDKSLVCTKSTLPLYKGKDFSDAFPKNLTEESGNEIFLAPDPIFGQSLYIAQRLPASVSKKQEIIAISISAEKLVELLNKRKTIFEMNLGVVSKDLYVISTTDPELFHINLILEKSDQTINPKDVKKGSVLLKETRTVKNGYKYFLGNKKRFCVLARLPNTNAFLLTSVPSKVLLAKMVDQLMQLGIYLACVLVVGGIAAFIFTKRISRPLKQLGGVMSSVGEGKLESRYKRDRMGFEINFLGERFNNMVHSLTDYIEQVKTERAHKESYAKELQIGHEIQQSILPKKEVEFPGIEVAAYFKPAKEVAGDFFDWLLKEDEILFTIADGVGKGVSSALYSFDLRSILRSFATTHDNLSDIVIKTNDLFCHDTKESGNFVTALLALYNQKNKNLQFVNCGHNYPFVKKSSGEVIRIEAKGIAFGVDEVTQVEVKTADLSIGDYFIMFTDGITDAQNKEEQLFTEQRLQDVISNSKCDSSESLINEIISNVEKFTDGADQYDDMTLIILKISK